MWGLVGDGVSDGVEVKWVMGFIRLKRGIGIVGFRGVGGSRV